MARDADGDIAPIYKNSKRRKDAETREAKKGDTKTGRDFGDDDDEEWESLGTETLAKDGKIVSPDGLDRKNELSSPPAPVRDLRVKDSDEGRSREWFKRKPGKPTS